MRKLIIINLILISVVFFNYGYAQKQDFVTSYFEKNYFNSLGSDSLGVRSGFTKFNFGSSSRFYFGNLWQTGSGNNYLAGKLGIVATGTVLDVQKTGAYSAANIAKFSNSGSTSNYYFQIADAGSGEVYAVLFGNGGNKDMFTITNTNALFSSDLLVINNRGGGNSFRVNDVASDTTPFVIDNSGNVYVGSSTGTYKTQVNSDILNAFAVSTTGGGVKASIDSSGVINSTTYISATDSILVGGTKLNVPDYVFDESYQSKTIDETENFVKENKHLPTMLSAEEIKSGHLNLADFSMRLLETIEIQHKQIAELNERIKKLEKK